MVLDESGNQLKFILYAFFVVTMTSSSQVLGLGEFQLLLRNFQNDRALASDATCCHENASTQLLQPFSSIPVCHQECRTFFRICLSHYQANIPAEPQCTYGMTTTRVLGANTFNLSDVNGTAYLVLFQFNFTWTGSFTVVIEAFHDLTSGTPQEGSRRKLILRLAVQRLLTVGSNWTRATYMEQTTESSLVYEYRVVCERTYYGPGCVQVCSPRDDVFGHYDCDAEGRKVCRNGWTGGYCESAVCLDGCNDTFGSCVTPFECRCRYGWQGRTCNECIRYPECNHGNCILPWQCNCFDGWGGPLCNIDLQFCTRYNPCLNGGTCSNDGAMNYTCRCLPGFQGRQCDVFGDACRQRPCLNGATCQATNGTYVCRCPAGFSGVRCEYNQTGTLPQGHLEVTISESLATSHSDEPTHVPSVTQRFVSSQGQPVQTSSFELSWVEITLIVSLGGVLPVLLVAAVATIFGVLKRRRRPDETPARPNCSRFFPTVADTGRAFPKLNNFDETNSLPKGVSLDSRGLTQNRKVLNVNSSTNFWFDAADQSESNWTRRRLPEIGPLPPEMRQFPPKMTRHSPEVQAQRYSETCRKIDRIPDIIDVADMAKCRPCAKGEIFLVPGVPRPHRTRAALEYVSVVARWRYEYPAESLTTDV